MITQQTGILHNEAITQAAKLYNLKSEIILSLKEHYTESF